MMKNSFTCEYCGETNLHAAWRKRTKPRAIIIHRRNPAARVGGGGGRKETTVTAKADVNLG